jgi:hypothetical protein
MKINFYSIIKNHIIALWLRIIRTLKKKIMAKNHQFLGVFAKLQRATLSFIVSVRPSAWNNSAPTGQFLMKFDI